MPRVLSQRWLARVPEGPVALAWVPEVGVVTATRAGSVICLDRGRGWERWCTRVAGVVTVRTEGDELLAITTAVETRLDARTGDILRTRSASPPSPGALRTEIGPLVAEAAGSVVRVRDTSRPAREPSELTRHTGRVRALAFGGPQHLYSCGDDGRIVHWTNARGWTCASEGRVDGCLSILTVDRAGLAAADTGGMVVAWDR